MTMDILKGLLLINGTDVFTAYGAYLVEEKKGDNKNYSALLKPPAAKSHTAVSFRRETGRNCPIRFYRHGRPVMSPYNLRSWRQTGHNSCPVIRHS